MNYKKLMILNILYVLIMELFFKIFVIKTIDISLMYTIIFSLFIGIIITILMSLTKKTIINRIISYIIWLSMLFIFIAETIYYSFYKTICGFNALSYTTQVMEFYNSIFKHIYANLGIIVFYLLLTSLLFILSIKKIKYNKLYIKDTLAITLSSIMLIFTSLEYNYNNYLAKDLIFNSNDIMESTVMFGLNTSIINNTFKTLTKFEEQIEVTKEKTYSLLDIKKEYNETFIDFDTLIDKEKDEKIKTMHEYFKNQKPTNKNEYTGIFAGKNLIFITAEGFSPIAVDEHLTPTLYKLVNSSFIFNNYYQPLYNCSTSDGEFVNMLSLLPGVSTCSMKETIGKYYPYNIGMVFKDYDYKTYGFHGWTYNYYNRDKTMPNFGYKYYGYDRYKKGYKYALKGIKDSWPTSDIDVINSSFDIYSNDSNFVAYYMSISGHLEYNFTGGNKMALKNKDKVKNIDTNDSIKAYLATQIEFDKSLELLINKLEEKNILDDTVIVISADHYPYGLTNKEIKSYVNYVEDENFDLYKNNLVIYNSTLENKVIDKYTSSIDILPTLLNMFGIRYDSRLLMGVDIMSDEEAIVIFNNKSWITKKGRYNYIKKKFYPFTDNIDEDYVDNINELVKLKLQMSKLVVKKDYYKEVIK